MFLADSRALVVIGADMVKVSCRSESSNKSLVVEGELSAGEGRGLRARQCPRGDRSRPRRRHGQPRRNPREAHVHARCGRDGNAWEAGGEEGFGRRIRSSLPRPPEGEASRLPQGP